MKRIVAVAALMGSLAACGGEDPVVLCEELVDRLVARAGACGVDEAEVRAQLAGELPCEDAKGVRDEAELTDECFPGVEDMDCDNPVAPDACSEQILF